MNSRTFWRKPQVLAVAMIALLGLAGLGIARASQKIFSPGLHVAMKMADPNEGFSRTGFAPMIKGVLPSVVNISTSKVVKASAEDFSGSDEIPPMFQQFFGQQMPGGQNFEGRMQKPRNHREDSPQN